MENATARTSGEKILVVYYSLTGNTARVAHDIAMRTGADIESIRDLEHGIGFFGKLAAAWHALRGIPANIGPLGKDPSDYVLTIIGTPVWLGRLTPAVRAYLNQTRGKPRNVAFFVTSGATDVARLVPSMKTLSGKKASASVGFTARELKDESTYHAKLGVFLNDVQWRHLSPQRPIGTQAPAI